MLPSRPRWAAGSVDSAAFQQIRIVGRSAEDSSGFHFQSHASARAQHVLATTTTTYSTLSSEHSSSGGHMTEQIVVAQLEKEDTLQVQDLMEPRSDGATPPSPASARVWLLEREVAAAKQTENKMLESLISQTKELEQAKMALEEAKLEAATLRQGPAQQGQWSVRDLMFGGVDEEINGLRARLRAALAAEERSRTAADDLAAALSTVTMEAKQVKTWLSDAQAELERASDEAGRLEALLRATEADLWSATDQLDGVMADWKEAAAAWRAREKALLGRARAAEEDAAGSRRENAELAEMNRAVDHDNDGLRRALERAAEEANAASESLEFASGENSELRGAVAEKEDAMESLRLQNESLKASEAAAQERATDLHNQLTAATKTAAAAGGGEKAAGLLLEEWKTDAQGKLSAAAFMDSGRVMAAASRKDRRMFASISNLAELRSAAAAAAMDDYYEFDHFDDGRQYGGLEHAMKHKKRRSVLRKFGDFFRRRSLHKSDDFAPVLAR